MQLCRFPLSRIPSFAAPMALLAAFSLSLPATARAQDTWASAPDMATGRYSPAAVRLPDNRVLVAGGHVGGTETVGAQLYSPATNAWAQAGSLKHARDFPVTLLVDENKDGTDETALIFGGYNSGFNIGTLKTVERYDVATNTFSYLTYKSGRKTYQSNMVDARELFTSTKLPDGRVLLVGGFKTFNWAAPNGTLKTAEIYDPVTKRFAATGSMSAAGTPYGRFGHDAILLPRNPADPSDLGRVLIVGGKERRSNSDWRSLRSIEIYDVATGTFSHVADMAYRRDRVTLAWVESAKKVLIVGGKSEAPGEPMGDVRTTEWFDPATNTVSPGPSLAQGRMGHTLTPLADGGFLVAGGWSESRTADGSRGTTASAERFTLIPDASGLGGGSYGFVPAGPTGSMLYDAHDHGAVSLADGRVLIVGGKQVTDGTTSRYPKRAEIYTP